MALEPLESVDQSESPLYSGNEGMQVLKSLLFHGFDSVTDIVTCASVSKELQEWSRKYVLSDCALKIVVKLDRQEPEVIAYGYSIPKQALLDKHPAIKLWSAQMNTPIEMARIKYFDCTVVENNLFVLHTYYDIDSPEVESRSTNFLNPRPSIVAWLTFVYQGTTVTGIFVMVRKRGEKEL